MLEHDRQYFYLLKKQTVQMTYRSTRTHYPESEINSLLISLFPNSA
jgi:hypothetical protein